MHIVIDGYNLLKSLFKSGEVSEKERNWFHAQVASYAKKKQHAISLVYDGGSFDRPTEQKKGLVTTVYSGWRSTADDVIKLMIDEKEHHDMLVVTTDNQLSSYAVRGGVPTMRVADFYAVMKSDGSSPVEFIGYKRVSGVAQKNDQHESSAELDALMQEGASILQYKEEGKQKEQLGQTTSKKERLAQKILKKL